MEFHQVINKRLQPLPATLNFMVEKRYVLVAINIRLK
jgi:hypothetical protein